MMNSSVKRKLPPDILARLNERLLNENHTLKQHREWLAKHGYDIPLGTLYRYYRSLTSGFPEWGELTAFPGETITQEYTKKLRFLGFLRIQRQRIDTEISRLEQELLSPWDMEEEAYRLKDPT
ncbi:hypothetical protein [Methylohalobius crimeensis]|uniref:hypothetical protein n=1 Tax=Methylohalobius crimeensis TaxID=244365 RepID=UPI0003B6BE6C|nr:hypothetical protein [Methylohalobius crimeensis]